MDVALHDVLDMAEARRWRRCYNCRAMVELQHGCNHIYCRWVGPELLPNDMFIYDTDG